MIEFIRNQNERDFMSPAFNAAMFERFNEEPFRPYRHFDEAIDRVAMWRMK